MAQTWVMRFDLGKRLFPDAFHKFLRPDIDVWSILFRQIIVTELTVPWEEGCEEANERKSVGREAGMFGFSE